MLIEVYTDGSATTKDKPGGWAFALVVDGKFVRSASGVIQNATNNDAELEAAIKGLASALHFKLLEAIKDDGEVVLCSDSEIVLGWVSGKYRFKQTAKAQKYVELTELVKRTKARTRWVEGHAGHEFNEMCDKLARAERRKAMGKPPKKESSKSTLMLQAIKEIDSIAQSRWPYTITNHQRDMIDWPRIAELCKPFLGNK